MRFVFKEMICVNDNRNSNQDIILREFFHQDMDNITNAFVDKGILSHFVDRVDCMMRESDEFTKVLNDEYAIFGMKPEEYKRQVNERDFLMAKIVSLFIKNR